MDPRVLTAARAGVDEGLNRSVGEAISALALAGLARQSSTGAVDHGLALLPSRSGRAITDEMVAEALLDD
ncbi:hypothetical protein EFY87_04635 [Flexivirga caeni]|uniref:Uncharacterized protein n=1 Tax=Flexivirga caeni TaxID=2294115 RepID=A0A3M9MHY5_9MICO|nr:hypothetical protein EFY87_04635 [Flexivirga caeni]